MSGKTPSSQLQTRNKRVLRVHSKFSAIGELNSFFTQSSIPRFNDQLLEAYVKGIALNYDSEHDRRRSQHGNAETASTISTQNGTESSRSATKSADDDQLSERSTSPEPALSKVYLQSGLFFDVQQQRRQTTKPRFHFSLPAPHTKALDRKSNFVLPYSIYCPSSGAKQPVWKNLKKSKLSRSIIFMSLQSFPHHHN